MPTGRAMRWRPFLAAGGCGLVVVGVPAVMTVQLSAADLSLLLRVAAVCAALGTAFLLDDPAAASTAVVPTTRLVRHAVRAGIALPLVVAWWVTAATVTAAGAEGPVGAALPMTGLAVEAAGMVAVAVGLAAAALRRSVDGVGSVIAAPALLVTLAALTFLPEQVTLFAAPSDPRWEASHHRWAMLLVTAVAAAAWASRDPIRGV